MEPGLKIKEWEVKRLYLMDVGRISSKDKYKK